MPTFSHLIVGLGNPGSEYAATRHNIGFMAVDAIAGRHKAANWKRKFKSLLAGHNAFTLLKPQTFMNVSGEAVGEAMRFFQLGPAEVIVFHDDLDLQPGQMKIKQGGGNAGHNGLKSIDAHIGPDYWRVRLGIGHPGVKGDAVMKYVLSPFAKADRKWLDPLLDAIAGEFDLLLKGKNTVYINHIISALNANDGKK